MIDATIAAVPLVMSHGTSGMNTPSANDTNEDTAACMGEPRFVALMPSSSRACVSRANSGSCHDLVHHVAGHGGGDAALLVHPDELLRLTFGALGEGLAFHVELALEELALGRHREVLPRPHGEGAGDQTGHPDQPDDLAAGTGATTPSTSEILVTRPSLTPKTAALAPPPRISRCWWNCCGSCTRTSVVIRGAPADDG